MSDLLSYAQSKIIISLYQYALSSSRSKIWWSSRSPPFFRPFDSPTIRFSSIQFRFALHCITIKKKISYRNSPFYAMRIASTQLLNYIVWDFCISRRFLLCRLISSIHEKRWTSWFIFTNKLNQIFGQVKHICTVILLKCPGSFKYSTS